MQKLGQHWMTSSSALHAVSEVLEISPGDTIVEIGPGRGALTDELVRESGDKSHNVRIIAIERDKELAAALQQKYSENKNIQILAGDVLDIFPTLRRDPRFKIKKYKLVGNIPYYITGQIIRLITTASAPPERAVLTMQKEVAERLTANPPRMNLLAAIAQACADIRIVKKVPRGAFSPPPKVESAIVLFQNIRPHTAAAARYQEFIRRAFSHPRKMLANNLGVFSPALITRIGLSKNARAHELSVSQLRDLAREVAREEKSEGL